MINTNIGKYLLVNITVKTNKKQNKIELNKLFKHYVYLFNKKAIMSEFNNTASDNVTAKTNTLEDPNFPYMPPCMRCQPIIDYTSIQYNTLDESFPLKLFSDPEWRFGTFNLHIRSEIPITSKHLHIFFTIDSSGSMSDMCVDGRTKIQHIHYTLENMIRIFHENQNCNISLHVQSFDSTIKTHIQDVSNIKEENLELIINKIKKILPGGSTNIEIALKSAFDQITEYSLNNSEHEVVHLFLTDGEISIGSKDKEFLKTLVPSNCTNIFIGYGLEHDSLLLSSLGNMKNNDYRFIDALEKAGLVYGELIHGILYKAITDVLIKSYGCEIYNFQTNTWSNQLMIGNLLSEQKKTYHIRSKTLESGYISVHGKTIIQTKQFQILSEEIEEQTVCHPCLSLLETNLNIFEFRQRTQELLYEVRQYSEKIRAKKNVFSYYSLDYDLDTNLEKAIEKPLEKPLEKPIDPNVEKKMLKTKLIEFRTLMIKYMKDKEACPIMTMLCDDIYICIRTLGTSVGNMFTYARQTSQGRQHTYACSALDSFDKKEPTIYLQSPRHQRGTFPSLRPLPPLLTRQTNNNRFTTDDDMDEIDVNEEFNEDLDEDLDEDFGLLSQNILTPYSSAGVVQLMREVSGNNTINK